MRVRTNLKEINNYQVRLAALNAACKRLVRANNELIGFIEDDEQTINELESERKHFLQEIERLRMVLEEYQETAFELELENRGLLKEWQWYQVVRPGESERFMVTYIDKDTIIFDNGMLMIKRVQEKASNQTP